MFCSQLKQENTDLTDELEKVALVLRHSVFRIGPVQAQEAEKRLQEQEQKKGKVSKEQDAKVKHLEDTIKALQGELSLLCLLILISCDGTAEKSKQQKQSEQSVEQLTQQIRALEAERKAQKKDGDKQNSAIVCTPHSLSVENCSLKSMFVIAG